jgi:hypothetical protein
VVVVLVVVVADVSCNSLAIVVDSRGRRASVVASNGGA